MSVPLSKVIAHDPSDKAAFEMDFAAELVEGETIASATVTVEEGTATVSTSIGTAAGASAEGSISGNSVGFWLQNGATPGKVVIRVAAVTSVGARPITRRGRILVGKR